MMRRMWVGALLLIALAGTMRAVNPEWVTPMPPFRIADNLYYVGSKDLASYLVKTPEGDILINSSLPQSVPLIERSLAQLGVRMSDIKILLISHAHSDHAGGSAAILRATHARYMVMDADVPVVESGGSKDFAYPNDRYPAAKVDRVLHDGDTVRLGGVVLVAHKTPGHTRGCTTWTMETTETTNQGRRRLQVVIVGSWYVNSSYRLVDRPGKPASYPGIAADYAAGFRVLRSLPCDVFLGAHGGYFGMLAKYARKKDGGENVWVDPEGYRATLAEAQESFETELKRQQGGR
jgi:metallo-beta-lactamase class B